MVASLRAQNQGKSAKFPRKKIPDYLVREVIDGIPFYYRGFKQVLNKTKTLEEIMSDSGLQHFLKLFLYDLLKDGLDRKKYRVGAGELGLHPNLKSNMGLDVTVFDRTVLTPDKISRKFVEVPPKFVIEVDVNVELPDLDGDIFQEYIFPKINRLFSFGTEKVVWIFTKSRKVLSAIPNETWQLFDWEKDVELFEGVSMNLAKYIEIEGFNLDI